MKELITEIESYLKEARKSERYRFIEKCPECSEPFLTIVGGSEHNGGHPIWEHMKQCGNIDK